MNEVHLDNVSDNDSQQRRMPRIIDRIPTMDGDKLLILFQNALRYLSAGPHVEAELVLAAIQREWRRQFQSGMITCSAERPEKGMLATLGYRVGSNGEKTSIRRRILKYVVEQELPVVASIAYTSEWGAPKSPQRYHKLVRFLESQLTNPGNIGRANMEKAMIEWSEDLEWVQKVLEPGSELVAQ
jgi:hypothetical protein